jgi:serine/threonine protein kinase
MTYIVSFFVDDSLKMDASTAGDRHSEALRNYKLGGNLGSGTFATVKIAEHKLTGHMVAIKIMNRQRMGIMEMEENGTPPRTTPLFLPLATRSFVNIFDTRKFPLLILHMRILTHC